LKGLFETVENQALRSGLRLSFEEFELLLTETGQIT